MDHSELISELPFIEKLTPAERIQLARERRALQLKKNREKENELPTPPEKTDRVRFTAGISLLEATARNDIDEVSRLLESGANPNAHNEDGLTPLHQCAIDNNEHILMVLLDHGADVNAQDTELWTPLHAAACCAHIDIVKHLINSNANLLAVNADGNMPYDICDEDATLDAIESAMASKGISQSDIDAERAAPERKMLADMKWLHQHGASLDYRDLDGASPLHVAAANGYYDVAAFLLRCHVSPSVKDDDSWTPMHAAACWAQPDVIELLAEYGGDVVAKTESGETALDLCEDDTTRAVIYTLQAEAARRKRVAFPRDSRRQSKKRKSSSKFESPNQQQLSPSSDSPFSTRGAIRRLSLRDRSGMTLARIEARKEAALMRSWSLEDTTAKSEGEEKENSPSTANGKASPPKDVIDGGSAEDDSRLATISADEWMKKMLRQDPKDPEPPQRRAKQEKKKKNKAPTETPTSSASGDIKDNDNKDEDKTAELNKKSNGIASNKKNIPGLELGSRPNEQGVQRFRAPDDSIVGPSPRGFKRLKCNGCRCTIL